MIRCCVLFFLVFSSISGFCQSFAPIGATWYYLATEELASNSAGYLKFECYKDTIIQLKKCRAISRKSFSSDGKSYKGPDLFLYERQSKVYQFIYGKFFVLYDFTAKTGDTLTSPIQDGIIYGEDSTVKYIVGSVGIKTINGIDLNYYTVKGESFPMAYQMYGTVIDYLGGSTYMFAQNMGSIDFGSVVELICYYDGTINYKSGIGTCDQIITAVENVSKGVSSLKTFPNPVDDFLTIEVYNNRAPSTICLNNVYGQIQRSFKLNASSGLEKLEINLKDLDPGIYFLKGFLNGQQTSSKIFKN